MPIFSRQELEALLDKCRKLPNAELKRRSGGETVALLRRAPNGGRNRSALDAQATE
jgi:hypothetical protein